ncbi:MULTISPECIES: hypothetical protein [unclassified Anaeromyxobacter]|uniref:hypothetical protein n=1 Tax=unclassified Anaeromyxobacter TaxID=2620896 RepID=UPI001F57C7DD|nr:MULTISPECIES: hypothetical protein [unclassified Anaeromyxobacter]
MTLKPILVALCVCFASLAQAQDTKPGAGEAKGAEQPSLVASSAPPAAPPAAVAPSSPPAAPPFTFALHGFVSASGYLQDANLGLSEGQQTLFVSGAQPATDKNALGFDVRQSRFNFSVKGPKVFADATPQAVLEIDFFQGFGAGGFGNVSVLNRMRLAYSELNWGDHRIDVGQLNDLLFAMGPTSLSHVAFPLGYATGNIGWRRPGVFGFHAFGAPDMKVELAWEVGRSQWNDAATGIGANIPNTPYGVSLGEASGLPALEARVTVSRGTALSAFVAGHWNRVDLTGAGTDGAGSVADRIDVVAGNLGAKGSFGPLSLAASGYYGKNTGPVLGNLVQFQSGGAIGTPGAPGATPAAGTLNDVYSWGGWGQAGYNLTKQLSVWGFYGLQRLDEEQAKKAQFKLLRNQTTDLMLQYRDGAYAVAFEWLAFRTKNASYAGTPAAFTGDANLEGNQLIATASYVF